MSEPENVRTLLLEPQMDMEHRTASIPKMTRTNIPFPNAAMWGVFSITPRNQPRLRDPALVADAV